MVKGKTVAFVVLLILMAGTVYATSVQPTFIVSNQPVGLIEFLSNLGSVVMGLCDPVPGGGGTGGDN